MYITHLWQVNIQIQTILAASVEAWYMIGDVIDALRRLWTGWWKGERVQY